MQALCVLLLAAALRHQAIVLPPLGRVWYVYEYESWNQAIAEIVEYGGDPKKYPLPLGDGHWVVIWETAGTDVATYPWHVEDFDSAGVASARYESLPSTVTVKKILTEPSGRILVIYKQP